MNTLDELIATLQARADAAPSPDSPTVGDVVERARLTYTLAGLRMARDLIAAEAREANTAQHKGEHRTSEMPDIDAKLAKRAG